MMYTQQRLCEANGSKWKPQSDLFLCFVNHKGMIENEESDVYNIVGIATHSIDITKQANMCRVYFCLVITEMLELHRFREGDINMSGYEIWQTFFGIISSSVWLPLKVNS